MELLCTLYTGALYWYVLGSSWVPAVCLWTRKWCIILEQLLYKEKILLPWVKEKEGNNQGGNKQFPTICSLSSKSPLNFHYLLPQTHSFSPLVSPLITAYLIQTGSTPPFLFPESVPGDAGQYHTKCKTQEKQRKAYLLTCIQSFTGLTPLFHSSTHTQSKYLHQISPNLLFLIMYLSIFSIGIELSLLRDRMLFSQSSKREINKSFTASTQEYPGI